MIVGENFGQEAKRERECGEGERAIEALEDDVRRQGLSSFLQGINPEFIRFD